MRAVSVPSPLISRPCFFCCHLDPTFMLYFVVPYLPPMYVIFTVVFYCLLATLIYPSYRISPPSRDCTHATRRSGKRVPHVCGVLPSAQGTSWIRVKSFAAPPWRYFVPRRTVLYCRACYWALPICVVPQRHAERCRWIRRYLFRYTLM